MMAFVITAILSIILIPLFNHLAGKTISAGLFQYPFNILILFLTALGIGCIAGIYPALVLSSYKQSLF
jgi:putative ABC transport system permease protein